MGIYTDIASVKRLFKANRGTRVYFVENSVQSLDTKALPKPLGVGEIGGTRAGSQTIYRMLVKRAMIVTDTSFSGYVKVMVYFDNATDYRVFESVENYDKFIYTGDGNIATDFVDPEGKYTILAGAISGTVQEMDLLTFEIKSDISDDEIEQFITDAEVQVDNLLIAGYHSHTGDLQTRVFADPDIPDAVSLATSYLTAYNIYTTVFIDQQRELEKQSDVRTVHFSERWKKNYMSSIHDYLKIATRKRPRAVIPLSNSSNKAICKIEVMKEDCQVGLVVECEEDLS